MAEGAKEMDMVRTHFHLLNGDVILLGNIGKEFLNPLLDLPWQHVTSVLGRPDQVLEGIVDGMGCSAEDHAAIVPPSPSVWQRALSPLPNTLIPPRRKQRGSLSVFRAPYRSVSGGLPGSRARAPRSGGFLAKIQAASHPHRLTGRIASAGAGEKGCVTSAPSLSPSPLGETKQ